MGLQKKPINTKKPINNSKSKLGKRVNHEKQTFGSWLTVAPVCLQAPHTAPATCVAMSFGVWYGGGSGKQRTEEGGSRGSNCVAMGFSLSLSLRSFCFVLIRA